MLGVIPVTPTLTALGILGLILLWAARWGRSRRWNAVIGLCAAGFLLAVFWTQSA